MKLFNLQEAIAGKPLVTRDGRDVTQFVKFDVDTYFVLFGVVDGGICHWNCLGRSARIHTHIHKDCADDLFMKTVKKRVYVTLYKSGHFGMYENENDAQEAGINSYSGTFAIAVPIEIEN